MEADLKYEIESQQYSIKLPKLFLKVYHILPGPLNSFALLGCFRVGHDILMHIDSQGQILYEHKFKHLVNSVSMINSTEVMVLEPRDNQIKIINLTNYSVSTIPFNFIKEEASLSQIFTFNKTKHICVVQKGQYNDNHLKLSYLATPLTPQSRPFQIYETNQDWNYQYLIKKGNEESMVIWHRVRHDEQFEIKTLSITQNKGTFNCYTRKNEIGAPYNYTNQIQTALNNVWQISPHKFCLACLSEKTNLGLKNKAGAVNNTFIWDVAINQIRQSKFYFNQKYNDFLTEIDNFGDFSIFRTFHFQNGKPQRSPCYYVHNKSEQIVATSEWQCSSLYKFQYPGFDKIFIQSQYQNSNVGEFKMKVIRVVELK